MLLLLLLLPAANSRCLLHVFLFSFSSLGVGVECHGGIYFDLFANGTLIWYCKLCFKLGLILSIYLALSKY
jgi:hypothetical protein